MRSRRARNSPLTSDSKPAAWMSAVAIAFVSVSILEPRSPMPFCRDSKAPRTRNASVPRMPAATAAMTHAAATETHGYSNIWQAWRERFAKLGHDQERAFLRAVV